MPTHFFAARVGAVVRWCSAIVSAVMIGLALAYYFLFEPVPATAWVTAALLLLLLLSGLFTVRGYRIDGQTLRVRRLLHETAIDLRGLRSVKPVPSILAGTFQLVCNGGLYSISGGFWRKGYGLIRVFAMDMGAGLELCWRDRIVMLTPENPDALLAELRKRLR